MDGEYQISVMETPVGRLTLVASGNGLREIRFGGEGGAARRANATEEVERQLREYFEGKRQRFELKLDWHGTGFQQEVWRALLRIPYGKTVSYADIAAAVKRPQAFRAVGGANRRNPWPIVVPCHRVIGSDGSLTGYAGRTGLGVKARLLELERQ
ncbi:MAG TPA: methylated-DNA--[protein]-cysteine S-methyltransferase [Terriglobales bacterium]|nr:methylated-DNA--[protein]-cysteine S-methyltransferase [Terriglobales bacterium]